MKTQVTRHAPRSAAEPGAGPGGQWSKQLRVAPRQLAQAQQLQALQRAGPEEELLQGKALQRAEEEEPLQGKALQRAEEEELLQGKALQRAEEEELLQGKALQRAEEEEPLQGKALQRAAPEDEAPLQGKPREGGLPGGLVQGIHGLSGQDLSDVRVHRNSSQPEAVNALAYAQGNDIHLAPGQERHLPHEAWHVVQQRQGRVAPTVQLAGGVPVNDDPSLEAEADRMGERALRG